MFFQHFFIPFWIPQLSDHLLKCSIPYGISHKWLFSSIRYIDFVSNQCIIRISTVTRTLIKMVFCVLGYLNSAMLIAVWTWAINNSNCFSILGHEIEYHTRLCWKVRKSQLDTHTILCTADRGCDPIKLRASAVGTIAMDEWVWQKSGDQSRHTHL